MLRDDRTNGGGRRPPSRNVLCEPLEICSIKPMTGFYRDGPRVSAQLCSQRITETSSKAISPTRPFQIQAEGALGLGIGCAPRIGQEDDGIANDETRDPRRNPAQRFGTQRVRHGGQPLRHGGWIIINDIINPRRAA